MVSREEGTTQESVMTEAWGTTQESVTTEAWGTTAAEAGTQEVSRKVSRSLTRVMPQGLTHY